MLPFIPFFPLQGYIGEVDNIILSGEIQYLFNRKSKIYGVLLIDEWTPPTTFSKDNHNWIGWQIGIEKIDLIFDDKFQFEYNWRWINSGTSLKNIFDYFGDTNYIVGKITKNEIQFI